MTGARWGNFNFAQGLTLEVRGPTCRWSHVSQIETYLQHPGRAMNELLDACVAGRLWIIFCRQGGALVRPPGQAKQHSVVDASVAISVAGALLHRPSHWPKFATTHRPQTSSAPSFWRLGFCMAIGFGSVRCRTMLLCGMAV